MKLAYIDSSVWISRIEGISSYQNLIDNALNDLGNSGWIFCISEAVILETLIKPYKNFQRDLIILYNKLFEQAEVLEISPDVFKNALLLSQLENLKAMDAVHLSIAAHHGCKRFISTDTNFRNLKTITPVWIDLAQAKENNKTI